MIHSLFCYIEEQTECNNTRSITSNTIRSVLKRNVPIEYACRVGKRIVGNSPPRKILVKFKFYSDKKNFLSNSLSNSVIASDFVGAEESIEKVLHDFCKKSLNISKFASNLAVRGELGRYPISHSANAFAVKYWLRLSTGTANALLNEAFNICSLNEFDYVQGIQYLLCENGFGNVWADPRSVNRDYFHKIFKQRLNDQYLQVWNERLHNSNRFKTLKVLEFGNGTIVFTYNSPLSRSA